MAEEADPTHTEWPYTNAVDTWQVGILLSEVLIGKHPFATTLTPNHKNFSVQV